MELILEPEIYEPNMDEQGNYTDRMPVISNGIRCPCGARKDKVFLATCYFAQHIKTQTHKKWLLDLTANKSNFYKENDALKKTIENQKLIIARQEIDILQKMKLIEFLTRQLMEKDSPTKEMDLIHFD